MLLPVQTRRPCGSTFNVSVMVSVLWCQVMKIRQMLTEVLLDVTNQEIETVAMETIEEAKSERLLPNTWGVSLTNDEQVR